MILLHNIGESPSKNPNVKSNYNTREEILASEGPLSFDGVYENVYHNIDILKDRDVILFVTGTYVGGDNKFDFPMPREKFCTWDQLMGMKQAYGFELGWHTWNHPDLTKLDDEELYEEVLPPFPMESFAYPYGKFDDRVIQAVREAGFKKAYGVFDGDGSDFQITRKYL